MRTSNPLTILTHGGAFHSDELIAIALVGAFVGMPMVTRARGLKSEHFTLTIDVNGSYDGDTLFDHHQFKDDDLLWGKSSAGLVADNPLIKPHLTDEFKDLIKAVDARDTRVSWNKDGYYEPLFNMVNDCNHINISGTEQEELFDRVLDSFTAYFSDEISFDGLTQKISSISEENTLEKDSEFKRRTNTIHEVVSGDVVVHTASHNAFIPFDRLGDDVYCLLVEGDKGGEYKVLTRTDILTVVDISDKVFVHANGFIGVTAPKNETITVTFDVKDKGIVEVEIPIV